MNPDQEQRDVLAGEQQFIAIDGNAGSAKSTTLAMKLVDAVNGGMRPQDILVLTHSAAAVLAFQQRLRWLGLAKEQVLRHRVTTFDSFCQERLQALLGACPFYEHPTRVVSETMLSAIARARLRAVERGYGDAIGISGDGAFAISALLRSFQRLKGALLVRELGNDFVLTRASALDVGLDFTEVAVFQAYERLRLEGPPGVYRDTEAPAFRLVGDPTYDLACELTADEPRFGEGSHPLSGDVKLVLIDEGHDVGAAAFTILRHIAEKNPLHQLLIVGDVDQVIHSDSGADAGYMGPLFESGIGQLARYQLTTCRRFGEPLARALAAHASKAYAFMDENRTSIKVVRAETVQAVATCVVSAFADAAVPDLRRVRSLAVIMRHPGDAVGLEIELMNSGFAVETAGFGRFYERPEVVFFRALIAWGTDNIETLAQADAMAIQDVFHEFTGCLSHENTRAVRSTFFENLKTSFFGPREEFVASGYQDGSVLTYADEESRAAIVRLLNLVGPQSEPRRVSSCLDDSGLVPLLKKALVNDEDVAEAMKALRSFADSAIRAQTVEAWLTHLGTLESSARVNGRAESRLVRLYSVPAAKGQEFDHVVIPDVDAAMFDGNGTEERNLFYVACSRARSQLVMTYRNRPSSYLDPFRRDGVWQES